MGWKTLITGANRGLGLEMARQMSARGDEVVATCRNPDDATDLQALGVAVHPLDVTDAGAVERFAHEYEGALDVLVNNAGVGVWRRSLGDLDYAAIDRCFATNSVAPLRLTEALLPRLRSGDRKLVVNMTSRMGSIADNSSGGAYGYRASKAALNMITRSLALDLEAEGITCVVLHPGWVQTDMGGSSARLTVQESVAGLVEVIDGLTLQASGGFFDFSGDRIPW